jgi:hypothetical protein
MDAGQPDRAAPYHGIVINVSQRRGSIFRKLKLIGRKRVFLGLIVLYKVEVSEKEIHQVLEAVQANMADRFLFGKKEFYAYFYRGSELIVVFREKIFFVSTDQASWSEAIAFGSSLGIADRQLDFFPHRIEQESY